MARTTVADVLVDGLARAGARRVFAGSDALAALSAAAQRRGLDVLDAPEATAAGVLAAVSGEVGDGPGALLAGLDDAPGLVRGLAHAQRDRSPLLVLTPAGADVALLSPVVKASLVVEPASAGHWVAHAANLALSDPRGPVHLAAAPSVVDESALPLAASCRPAPLPPAEPASLEALGEALATADRPLVVTGLECGPDDVRWIRSFAEALPAPVLATLKGRGALADPHPLALGALAADHPALARADLVLLLGVDAGELPPGVLPRNVRVARIGRAPWPDGGLVEARGELALVIEELAPRVRAKPAADWDVAEVDRIKRAVRQASTTTAAARLVALAREATPAGTLATGDVPALAAWQAVGPRETLAPLGFTPGYAVLAAVATQLAQPERRVIAFTSRGGLATAEAWLARAVTLGLPIVVVTLDALDAATAAAVERAGTRLFTSRGEPDFALAFSRAFVDGHAAVVAAPIDGRDRV
jgi:thiamine pyrophosphate-dependent acetolactate synthase large subunit-like protein